MLTCVRCEGGEVQWVCQGGGGRRACTHPVHLGGGGDEAHDGRCGNRKRSTWSELEPAKPSWPSLHQVQVEHGFVGPAAFESLGGTLTGGLVVHVQPVKVVELLHGERGESA